MTSTASGVTLDEEERPTLNHERSAPEAAHLSAEEPAELLLRGRARHPVLQSLRNTRTHRFGRSPLARSLPTWRKTSEPSGRRITNRKRPWISPSVSLTRLRTSSCTCRSGARRRHSGRSDVESSASGLRPPGSPGRSWSRMTSSSRSATTAWTLRGPSGSEVVTMVSSNGPLQVDMNRSSIISTTAPGRATHHDGH